MRGLQCEYEYLTTGKERCEQHSTVLTSILSHNDRNRMEVRPVQNRLFRVWTSGSQSGLQRHSLCAETSKQRQGPRARDDSDLPAKTQKQSVQDHEWSLARTWTCVFPRYHRYCRITDHTHMHDLMQSELKEGVLRQGPYKNSMYDRCTVCTLRIW